MSRLILLHSYGRTSGDNWYQSVGQAVTDVFGSVEIPDLPDPEVARAADWLSALEQLQPDEQTVLVGHSLGGTLILRYLEQAQRSVAGIMLVAAPINDLARNDLHDTGFFTGDFDWSAIQQKAAKRYVVGSTDDPTVPFWQAESIALNLPGELITLRMSHFPN